MTLSCEESPLSCLACEDECSRHKHLPEHWRLQSVGEGFHLVRRDGVVLSTFKSEMGFWGWAVVGGWPRTLRTDFWCVAEGAMEYPDPNLFLEKFDEECPRVECEGVQEEFLDETSHAPTVPQKSPPESRQKLNYVALAEEIVDLFYRQAPDIMSDVFSVLSEINPDGPSLEEKIAQVIQDAVQGKQEGA